MANDDSSGTLRVDTRLTRLMGAMEAGRVSGVEGGMCKRVVEDPDRPDRAFNVQFIGMCRCVLCVLGAVSTGRSRK